MDLAACWESERSAFSLSDSIYVFAGFDECKENEAVWLLEEFREKRQCFEEPLKMVLLTTAGSPQDGRICEVLSKMPADSVTTIDYSDEKVDTIKTDLELSALIQDDPRYADASIAQRIGEVIGRCDDDNDLIHLFISVLRSSANHTRVVQSLTFDGSPPGSGLIFQLALSEIADEHRPWAKLILSWVSAAVRPLRVHEFHLLSEMCNPHSGGNLGQQAKDQYHPKVRYEVERVIQKFHGLLRIENDEVHFSHRKIRPWLVSQRVRQNHPHPPAPWYFKEAKESDHKDIVDLCLTYLGRLVEVEESNAAFSYIIEHWTYHYKLAGGEMVERVLKQVLSDTTVLNRWITLYKALPTPPLKPMTSTPGAFDIAAHFGLGDCVKLLITTGTHQRDSWVRAILEAVRVAELPTVQLLFQSMPYTFNFNDEDLHEIVGEAIHRGHPEISMEVIRRIPKSSEPIPDWKLMKAKRDAVVSNVNAMGISDDPTPQDDSSGSAATSARRSSETQVATNDKEKDEGQSSPFTWLGLPLCQAARRGLNEAVRTFLALGADPNSRPLDGESTHSPMSRSCVRGHEEVVRILLDNGADMEMRTGTGSKVSTPLYLACTWGRPRVVRLLLERGASVTAKHDAGFMPLHAAAKWGTYSCVEALLEHRRCEEYLLADDPAPLPLAVRSRRYLTAEVLLRHGLDPNSHDSNGTALWHAILTDRADTCRLLLDYKADPNADTDNSAPPLVLAMQNGKMEIIKMLVEKGADIEKPGSLGGFRGTPLLMAVVWGTPRNSQNIEALQYLLERKADPNVLDKGGWSPLWLAAWWRVRYLHRPYLTSRAN